MKRLNRSLLCCTGLILLTAPSAPAAIVHVPLNQTLSAGFTFNNSTMNWEPQTVSYDLDINSDGTTDLTFSEQSVVATGTKAGWTNRVTAQNGAAVGASPISAPVWLPQFWANPLLSSDTVGPDVGFAPANAATTLYTNNYFDGQLGYAAWTTTPDKFLPVQFNINGSPHFGWVHLKVDWDFTSHNYSGIELYDAAYESQPNTPLPEPSSLLAACSFALLPLTRCRTKPKFSS